MINEDQSSLSVFKEIYASLERDMVNLFKKICKRLSVVQESPAIVKGKLASWKAVASSASLYRSLHCAGAEPTIAFLRRHRHSEL